MVYLFLAGTTSYHLLKTEPIDIRMTMTDDGKLTCQVCGFIGHNLGGHIRTHKMTGTEYKRMYSVEFLQSKMMIDVHKANIQVNNPMLGKKRTEEEKTLMFENRTGKGIGISGKYVRTNVIKEKTSNSVSKLHMEGVYDYVRPGISGYIHSSKMDTTMHYKSTWEKRLIECMDIWPRITAFHYEPIRIKYMNEEDGAYHNFIPDFMVVYDEEITAFWEIKRQDILDHDLKTQSKIRDLEQYCFEKRCNMATITLPYIEKLERHLKQCTQEELEDYDTYIRKYIRRR